MFGPLAHLVEHLICNEGVAGSSPVRSTVEKRAPILELFFIVSLRKQKHLNQQG